MAKQINFYMMKEDESDFMDFVNSDRRIAILNYILPSPELILLHDLPSQKMPRWFLIWLWDISNSPPPILRYISEQNYYVIDRFASEVIGFSRSSIDQGRLIRGRIWAEMSGWRMDDPSVIFKKSDSFVKWFNRIASWIKRKSKRDKMGDYLLPGAQKFVEAGGKLTRVAFAESVKLLKS